MVVQKLFRFLSILAFCLATLPCLAAYELRNEFDVYGDVSAHHYQLDNGLTVVLVKNPRAPLANIYHWIKAGSLHEKRGTTGIAHLFEHMMFRPLKPGEASFADKMKKLAAEVNANTRFESTVYTTSVPTNHLQTALKYEAGRFKNMHVTDELLNLEREAVRSEYSTKFDANPVIDTWFTIYREAFVNHPYGWMIVGFREDLDKITAADANRFFRKYYSPNNAGLFIGGDIDPDEVIKWIDQEYKGWRKGEDASMPEDYVHDGSYVHETGNVASNSRLALIGHRIPSLNKDNYLLLNVANHIVYGSDMSLARRSLLFDKPLVSEVSEFNFDYDNGMLKAIVSPLPNTDIKTIVTKINKLPEQLSTLPDDQYKAYLREYRTSVLEQIQRNESLIALMSLSWGKFNDLHYVPRLVEEPINISKQHVAQVLSAQMKRSNTVVVETKKGDQQ